MVAARILSRCAGPGRVAGSVLACFIFAACATAPSRHPDFVPDDLKAVYVFSVMAPADAGRMAARMTREIVRLLSSQRKVYPVDELPLADGLIEVRVERIFLEPVSRSADGKVDRARWCCEVEFSFRDTRRKSLLLDRSRLIGVRQVQLVTPPVTDLETVSESMADQISAWIVDWCMSGKPPRYNPLFGYEHLPDTDSNGILIGKPRANRDKNNDGIDDALQGLTNETPDGKSSP